ncbi:MAG: complex I NDUFA9 subunit family protein [Pseudomonadota bacterium]
MAKGLVTVFGGSGFIGRYTARALVREGYRVRVACRRPHLASDVRLAGSPGWVDLIQANVRHRPSVDAALEGADAVVNLVGILHESGKQSFDAAQGEGARNVAEAAAMMGIKTFVQMSAINVSIGSKSGYARTKAEAENAVKELIPTATVLRPSVVFGPEDQFFNRFAGMARFSPALPAIGGGKTKLQPVYAGDVADAIAASISSEDAAGKTYELGGPRVYSFNEIYDTIFDMIGRKRFKAPLPFLIAKPMGLTFGVVFRYIPPFSWGLFGGPPITGDQVTMLREDNVVGEGALTLSDLGVTELESVESIVPTYLWRFRPYGEFSPSGDN